MADQLLAPSFLFRFAVPCLYRDALDLKRGFQLAEESRLMFPGELERAPIFADVRAAWNDSGLAFSVRVAGKRHSPWCHRNRLEDSDSLQVWIDTRDTHNIHRAGRFCHRFVFLPTGGGSRNEEPWAEQLLINRARENAKAAPPAALQVRSQKLKDGYTLEAFIAAAGLTGFDPAEHPKLGFNYLVLDRELGEQAFSVSAPFPFMEDPTLWGTLELVR